jgi:hypothetical protein
MENAASRAPSTPAILGIVGGIALAIGSFLNWATVSVNFDKIATAIGIDPADVPADVRAQGTVSVTGWKGGDGKWTLVAGVVVIVAAVLLSMASSRRVVGIVMLVGGVVGGGLALYDATIQKNDAIDNAASTFAGIGLPGELRDYFSISLGIGIWLCVAGGIVAIVAGIMAMTSSPSTVAVAGDPAGFTPPPPLAPDGGFATGGAWTGMPEGTGMTPDSGTAPDAGSEPDAGGTPESGGTAPADVGGTASGMPEAEVPTPDPGSGTGVPPEDPPSTP